MFVVPCFIAILTGRRISDVLRPFETKAQAIGQCHAWTHKTTDLHEEHVPGYEYWAQYGGEADTVRVERHTLDLDDSDDTTDGDADSKVIVLEELRSLTRGAQDCAKTGEVDA